MGSTECNGFMLIWGAGAFVGGVHAAYTSILSWRHPSGSAAMERVYPAAAQAPWLVRVLGYTAERQQENPKTQRVLGTILGPVFIFAGLWVLITQLQCPDVKREFTSATHLQFRFWPPIVVFVAFAVVLDVAQAIALRMRPTLTVLSAILVAAWALAGGEAAAFHIGEMAKRWATASMLLFMLVLSISLFGYYGKKKATNQSRNS